MLHDPTPQANGLIDPTQPVPDADDERIIRELQTLYLAPQIPERLRQTGAEQVRRQLDTGQRHRAGHEAFGLPTHVRAGARASDRLNGNGRHEGPSRPATLVAVAAVALVSLLAAALFARPGLFARGPAATGSHQKPTPPPALPMSGPPVTLMSVAMVSANDGWAFGATSGGSCLVLHYNGSAWARSQGSACASITSIAMLSADDGWAVGDKILHYTQGHWQVDTGYAQSGLSLELEHVAMLSPDEGWAVGWTYTTQQAAILHYIGGHWTPVKIAGMAGVNAGGIRGIAMVSAQEGWAVGSQFTSNGEATLVLHYHNGQWTRLNWSIPGSFNSVVAFPSGDVWVAGEDNPAAGPGLIVHLRDGVPIQEYRPIPGLIERIAMVSPNDGWAIGDGAATVRYHDGVWTREGLTIHQFYMNDISLVSATEGWAVGNTAAYSTGNPDSDATLFHLSNGVWRIYPLSGV